MRPNINPAGPPSFHDLRYEDFQRLCNELLAAEPGVTSSFEYGKPGEEQRGIDLIASREGKEARMWPSVSATKISLLRTLGKHRTSS